MAKVYMVRSGLVLKDEPALEIVFCSKDAREEVTFDQVGSGAHPIDTSGSPASALCAHCGRWHRLVTLKKAWELGLITDQGTLMLDMGILVKRLAGIAEPAAAAGGQS